MKVIFWGTPQYAVNSLKAILADGYDVIAVVTQPDKKRGRGSRLIPSPVKEEAQKNGIKVYTSKKIKSDEEVKKKLFELNADIYIVVAFGQILPKEILNHPPLGCWNSHASLLPRWRGAAPIQWCLIKGDKSTGVGIMSMEATLDTGPIINQKSIPIKIEDNFYSISQKLSNLSGALLVESMAKLSETYNMNQTQRLTYLNAKLQPQNGNRITYARQISKQDYLINWDLKSIEIHRMITGLTPNSYTFIKQKRLKIVKTIPLMESFFIHDLDFLKTTINSINKIDSSPGELITLSTDDNLFIKCNDLPLMIIEGQLEGKKVCNHKVLRSQLTNLNKK